MSAERQASELTVAILPLGTDVSSWLTDLTAEVLKKEFGVNSILLPAAEIPKVCFSSRHDQYKEGGILDFIFLQLPTNAQRIVGILTGDLVDAKNVQSHGIADLHDRAAVYSEPWYCVRDGEFCLTETRAEKQELVHHLVMHEFGHTLGIKHCDNLECTMTAKGYNLKLCSSCRRWADRELKVKPCSAEEYFSRAESLNRHNQLSQAINAYRKAIACSPTEPLYYNRLSVALKKSGQPHKASRVLAYATKLSDEDYPPFYQYGLIHVNNLKKAEARFNQAISAAKDLKAMHRWVGQAYREIFFNVELASRHYQEYLKLGGDDPDVIEWLVSRGQLDTH